MARARKAAKRWFTESEAKADARRGKALRRIGSDILDQAIPTKLLEALQGKRGDAQAKPKDRK